MTEDTLTPKPYRHGAAISSMTRLWPDADECVSDHAKRHNLTKSGAIHDVIRRFFSLPLPTEPN
jgi:hypothetical protein